MHYNASPQYNILVPVKLKQDLNFECISKYSGILYNFYNTQSWKPGISNFFASLAKYFTIYFLHIVIKVVWEETRLLHFLYYLFSGFKKNLPHDGRLWPFTGLLKKMPFLLAVLQIILVKAWKHLTQWRKFLEQKLIFQHFQHLPTQQIELKRKLDLKRDAKRESDNEQNKIYIYICKAFLHNPFS